MADNNGIDQVLASINGTGNPPNPPAPATPPATPATPATPPATPTTPDPNSEAARNAAFAALRVEKAKLQEELDALKKQLNQPPAPAPNQPPAAPQPKPEESDLAKRLAALEQREQERIATANQNRIISELTGLRNKYGLGPEQLQQFAKDAAAQGIDLRNTDRGFESIYRDIHFVELIEAEVNRRLRPGQPAVPGTGPQGGGTGGKTAPSIAEVIASLNKPK